MPWSEVGDGYTTARGGFIRNPAQYEALRKKGMSKSQAAAIVNKRDVSERERARLAGKGDALSDGSFPIKTRQDLMNARHDIGRSKHPAAARALIRRRAKELDVSMAGSAIAKGLPSAVRQGGGGIYGAHLRQVRRSGRMAAKARAAGTWAPYADEHHMALGRSGKAAGQRWLGREEQLVARRRDIAKDAFGIERPDLVEKAGSEIVRSAVRVGGGASREAGEGAQRARRSKFRGSFKVTDAPGRARRAAREIPHEFKRGYKGGLLGSTMAAQQKRNLSHVAPDFKTYNRGRKGTNQAFKQARENAYRSSTRPGATKTGATAGRATAFTARNPAPVLAGGLITAGAGTAAYQTEKETRKRRKEPVAKLSPGAAAGLGYGALLGGAIVGGNEIERRVANKHGANQGFVEGYRHPIRSGHKRTAALNRHYAQEWERQAKKREEKAKTRDPNSRRGVYNELAIGNLREGANMFHYAAQAHNQAAIHGGRRARKTGKIKDFDPSKTYKSPSQIGKARDAFGVEREVVSKAPLGEFAERIGLRAARFGGATVGHAQRIAGPELASAGKFIRANKKPLAIGTGAGVAAAGGAALLHRDNQRPRYGPGW